MTHFTVLVKFEGELADAEQKIEEMLAPYDENKEVKPYKRYLSNKEAENAKTHYKIPNRNMMGGCIGDGKLDLTSEQIAEYFGGKSGGKDGRGYFYMSTYNKLSKWDWYSIGGRWQGMLTLKAGAKGRYVRQPNRGNNDLPIGEQLKRVKGEDTVKVDIAYLKDVDFEKMYAEDIAEITEDYYKAVDWLLAELEKGKTIDECASELYFEYQIENESLEDKLARQVNFSTHAVVDEKGWQEWSKMGWWGMHGDGDEADWNKHFKERFLSNPTDKTVIAMVDCHI